MTMQQHEFVFSHPSIVHRGLYVVMIGHEWPQYRVEALRDGPLEEQRHLWLRPETANLADYSDYSLVAFNSLREARAYAASLVTAGRCDLAPIGTVAPDPANMMALLGHGQHCEIVWRGFVAARTPFSVIPRDEVAANFVDTFMVPDELALGAGEAYEAYCAHCALQDAVPLTVSEFCLVVFKSYELAIHSGGDLAFLACALRSDEDGE